MTGLERDYPSTVSTVSKTLAKVVPKGASNGECQLCQRYAKLLFCGASIYCRIDLYSRVPMTGSARLPLPHHDAAGPPHRCMMGFATNVIPHKIAQIEGGESHRGRANSSLVNDSLISQLVRFKGKYTTW